MSGFVSFVSSGPGDPELLTLRALKRIEAADAVFAGVVDAIEQGDEILAEALVRSHVEALKRRMPHPQAAILGCTHYPLMQKAFADALGPDVKVYSQANLVAESLADYLQRRPEMLGSGTEAKFLTTGDPASVSSKATQFMRKQVVFQAA